MTQLAGSRTLIRLAWRRDRIFIPVGVVAMTVLAVASVQATLALYPDTASLGPAVRAVLTNPASKALYGPVSDLNDPDAFAVYKTTMMGAVFLALFGAAANVAITLVPARRWAMRWPWRRNATLWGGFVVRGPEGAA